MKIERTRIHFSATLSLPSSSSDLKAPNVFKCTGQFDGGHLRADVCKFRPEVGKIKFLKNPKKHYVDSPWYSSNENINFSFIG